MGCIKSRPMKARMTPPSSPYYIPFHHIDKQLINYRQELAIYQMECEEGLDNKSYSLSTRNLHVRSWIADSHPEDVEQRIARLTLLRCLIVDMACLSVRIREKRGVMTTQRRIFHSSCPNLSPFVDCVNEDNENEDSVSVNWPL